MSVLAEEEAEALQHVLAFLDEQESLLQLDKQEPKDDLKESEDRRSGESVQQRRREQRLATKMRYRGRVKEEYSRLRSDARALETALARLKDSKQAAEDKALVKWFKGQAGDAKETAAREYRRRKEAESTNQQLKLLLVRVRKACSSSAGIWDKILSDKNVAAIHEPLPLQFNSIQLCELQNPSRSIDSLSKCMDGMVLDSDRYFDRAGITDSDSFLYRMERVVDPALGSTFQIAMSSLLPCSLEYAESLISRDSIGHGSGFKQKITENVTEYHKKCVRRVRSGQQQFEMEGRSTVREIVEADRIRVVWSTLAPLLSERMIVREDCIMAARPCAPLSTPACLLQIWYRVYAEPIGPVGSGIQANPASEMLKESVLRSHCRTTGEFFQSIEKVLANEVYSHHPCDDI